MQDKPNIAVLTIIALAIACLAAHAIGAEPIPPGLYLPCKYVRCLDGDTVVVSVAGHEVRVRLKDCWAPERNTADGKRAKRYAETVASEAKAMQLYIPAPESNENLLKQMVTFDRVVGHVLLDDGKSLSERMVAAGHATKTKQKAGTQ